MLFQCFSKEKLLKEAGWLGCKFQLLLFYPIRPLVSRSAGCYLTILIEIRWDIASMWLSGSRVGIGNHLLDLSIKAFCQEKCMFGRKVTILSKIPFVTAKSWGKSHTWWRLGVAKGLSKKETKYFGKTIPTTKVDPGGTSWNVTGRLRFFSLSVKANLLEINSKFFFNIEK